MDFKEIIKNTCKLKIWDILRGWGTREKELEKMELVNGKGGRWNEKRRKIQGIDEISLKFLAMFIFFLRAQALNKKWPEDFGIDEMKKKPTEKCQKKVLRIHFIYWGLKTGNLQVINRS